MKTLTAAIAIFFLVAGYATAETSNTLSDAQIQGRQLAQQLCDAQPAENFTNTGILIIRDGKGNRTNYPVKFIIIAEATNWRCVYDATQNPDPDYPIFAYVLLINHFVNKPNDYITFADHGLGASISNSETMFPFCHSDFWICDLGLEFFHWSQQKVLPNPTPLKRGRSYTLLESTNPNPSTNGYSRVLSWIDKESGGILEAEAYDVNGKLLKDFAPKSFKKVDGQWQLQEMEIRNVQTGSRTRLEFDLKK